MVIAYGTDKMSKSLCYTLYATGRLFRIIALALFDGPDEKGTWRRRCLWLD
jgi:hypothetical protein